MVEHITKMAPELLEKYSATDEDRDMFQRMVPVILRKGIDDIDLSMFDESTKIKLLDAVGDECFKKGKINDAFRAYMKSKNKQKLVDIGNHFKKNNMFSE